jgi:hypothetical protein
VSFPEGYRASENFDGSGGIEISNGGLESRFLLETAQQAAASGTIPVEARQSRETILAHLTFNNRYPYELTEYTINDAPATLILFESLIQSYLVFALPSGEIGILTSGEVAREHDPDLMVAIAESVTFAADTLEIANVPIFPADMPEGEVVLPTESDFLFRMARPDGYEFSREIPILNVALLLTENNAQLLTVMYMGEVTFDEAMSQLLTVPFATMNIDANIADLFTPVTLRSGYDAYLLSTFSDSAIVADRTVALIEVERDAHYVLIDFLSPVEEEEFGLFLEEMLNSFDVVHDE